MRRKRVDCIVLGAGAAGLAAARELSEAGKTVVVLEARQRIGGRVFTLHDRSSPLPIELGAEFVHGTAPESFAIIRAARLLVNQIPDRHAWLREGKATPIPDFWGTVDKVRKGVAVTLRRRRAPDMSFADFLDAAPVSSTARRMMINFVEGYHAAHVERMSALSIAAGDEETRDEGGNAQFRVASGTDALIQWLHAGLDPERVDVRLNTIATRVRWKRGEVAVESSTGSGLRLGPFHARCCIITLPVGVMKSGALEFDPPPAEKLRAFEKLEAGQIFKMILRFRRPFWPDELNFVHSRETDVPTWWTMLPARAPILTAWAGGPKAESLLNDDESTRLDRALSSASRVFGKPRREIEELLDCWSTHDWRSDPFSRGAYTYVAVGGVTAQKSIAKPVESTLFFAGEATEADQTGTVAGAITSGRRAARLVLRSSFSVLRSPKKPER